MNELFLKIINMSISASWLVLAVLLLRFVLKKAPKWVNVLLWGIVAVRLAFPFSIESALSLIPSAETIPPNIGMNTTPTINSGINAINNAVNPIISQSNTPMAGASVNPLQITIGIFEYIWIFGMIALALYTAISYWRLHRKVDAVPFQTQYLAAAQAVQRGDIDDRVEALVFDGGQQVSHLRFGVERTGKLCCVGHDDQIGRVCLDQTVPLRQFERLIEHVLVLAQANR